MVNSAGSRLVNTVRAWRQDHAAGAAQWWARKQFTVHQTGV